MYSLLVALIFSMVLINIGLIHGFKIIVPGTKWCGVGDKAKSHDQLGRFSDIDTCCRAHDNCPDYIEGFQTKYNLKNPEPYTRLHCKCDDEFRKCLKIRKGMVSKLMGIIYFGAVGDKCFREIAVTDAKNKQVDGSVLKRPKYEWVSNNKFR